MEVIDGNWLRARLTGEHGEQRRLADAVGIGQDKITKILAGVRSIRPHEAPKFVEYFSTRPAAQGFSEPPASFSGSAAVAVTVGQGILALMQSLCPGIAHAATYQVTRAELGAALLPGDLLIVDLSSPPRAGDLVLVTKNDPETDTQETVIRRFLPPYLVSPSDPSAPPESSEPSLRSAIMATIAASARPRPGHI